jgi:hypothetical protein
MKSGTNGEHAGDRKVPSAKAWQSSNPVMAANSPLSMYNNIMTTFTTKERKGDPAIWFLGS